jgi:hypothetical protein
VLVDGVVSVLPVLPLALALGYVLEALPLALGVVLPVPEVEELLLGVVLPELLLGVVLLEVLLGAVLLELLGVVLLVVEALPDGVDAVELVSPACECVIPELEAMLPASAQVPVTFTS